MGLAATTVVARPVRVLGTMATVVERVGVKPELLTWARRRAGLSRAALRRRFPKLQDWETGARLPTRKQFEAFARATHVPTDWLFLDTPPVDRVPIPDRRVRADRAGPAPTCWKRSSAAASARSGTGRLRE
jgi:hypothetical protein